VKLIPMNDDEIRKWKEQREQEVKQAQASFDRTLDSPGVSGVCRSFSPQFCTPNVSARSGGM